MKVKVRNKKIIIGLIVILMIMSVGYAAFSSSLTINGTANITSKWDIHISDIKVSNTNGLGQNINIDYSDTLTANLESTLVEKGDYVEYEVTITNDGTLDAVLSNIEKEANNNDAIKISFSNYTKGETLKAGNYKTIYVKIECIKEGEGEATSKITFNYTQEDSIVSVNRYLVTYDCTTNGGDDCSEYNEYLKDKENINLSYTLGKQGLEFIGWNTDKDATSKLDSLSLNGSNVTLYAIYKIKEPPVIDNVSMVSTTNSISVYVTAHDDNSNITKYYYSIDGADYIESTDKEYTFTKLKQNTTHTIKIKVENEDGLSIEKELKDVSTNEIEIPTFSLNKLQLTITYPDGCGKIYTCVYKTNKDTDFIDIGTDTTKILTLTSSIEVQAKVIDKTNPDNFVSNTYVLNIKAQNISYDNNNTSIDCSDVQCALDKLKKEVS